MTINVHFLDEQGLVQADIKQQLMSLIHTGADILQVDRGEVSVVFMTDEDIQHLNRDYRHRDQSTDVLSFPMYEGEVLYEEGQLRLPTDEELMWGDIMISIPTARRQAKDYGHSLARELGFLLMHGFLHLLGYDHDQEASEKVMFRLQEDILAQHHLVR